MVNISYEFKVNGVQFAADKSVSTALEILKQAKEGGAIPNNPEEYILSGEKGQYQGDDKVNLEEDNVFITVPKGSTPYAWPKENS